MATSGSDRPLGRRTVLRGIGLGATAALAPALPARAARPAATSASPPPWSALRSSMAGPLYLRGASGYSGVARGFNPRFDAIMPSAVARCASAPDVAAALRFAGQYSVPFTVRSGGHALAGWSTGTGLVIDVSSQSSVVIDASSATATVGTGTRLIDLYQKVSAAGFAIPGGTCPSVGIAGLTLGGGIGALTRAWGLTCDQLRGATVVFADGSTKAVDDAHWPGLFWALKGGGGGSFGVATSFTFALRPTPALQNYSLGYPFSAAADVLAGWQAWAPYADPRLSSDLVFRATRTNGSLTVGVSGRWTGPPELLGAQIDALVASIGTAPTSRRVANTTFLQAALDDAGCAAYGSCHLPPQGTVTRQPSSGASTMAYQPLSSQGIQTVIAQVRAGLSVPKAQWTGLTIVALGGAVRDVSITTSAFAHREALFMMHYLARWSPSTPTLNPAPYDGYVRGFRAAMAPYLGSGAYVNYQDSAISDFGNAYWPGTYAQLRSVKSKVDPGNAFRFPQSVVPA